MGDFVQDKARPEIFKLKAYVPGKPIEEVKRELGIDDVIKLASNENPLGASPLGKKAAEKALNDLHIYPDSNCYYLKNKISKHTGIDQQGILVGNGSDELLKLLAETFLSPGDEVIYAEPSFMEYEFTARIMGADCVAVPLDASFKHDLPAMQKAITGKTKIIYLCNPNNPTGSIVGSEEIDQFMAAVPEDVLVVFDEAYYEYVESSEYVSGTKYLSQGRNVVVMRTLSKIYGLAALRVGYALTTPEIAQAVERVTEPFNVNHLAQVAATAALDDINHVNESRKTNQEGKQYLYSEFEKLALKYVPTEANFIFVDTGKECRGVFQALLEKGVIVRTGDIFGYPTFIRVTIGNKEENERFVRSLIEVLK